MKCPKCSRDTYSKKWNSCTSFGCSLNHSVLDTTPIPVTRAPRISVTIPAKRGRPKKDGALTNAERQRAYRERQRAGDKGRAAGAVASGGHGT
jgi:hypothetical protein